ncbi:CBO0543 family protein [Peribacillus sp. V2I11]|uniref:CBO0543 family protein n=1 Tax=Peribacillus sp. V2I11 TaxID=3042277 RepID=UPI002787974F|nr:CBO0543 family protein [Peribacillus sp. V2I11]MDQ0883684.1 hypothetical protein [Peribacillus sp. V2I11]
MLFHIIVGFILPWILGIYLFRNQTRLFITFFPIGVAVATLINDIGFNYFWEMDKNFKDLSLPSIPYNLGLYPILCCLFICSIHYKKMSTLITFLVFSLVTSFFESLIVLLGKLEYRNEWNIYWSAVSYLMVYLIIYGYYKLVRKFILFK